MKEKEFRLFLKQEKKQEKTINRYVKSVKILEDFLKTQGNNKKLEEVVPEDIRAFFSWGKEELKNIYLTCFGVRQYYRLTKSVDVEYTINELMEDYQNETRLIREFPKIDKDAVDKLGSIGIRTVNQLLDAGKTQKDREILAEKSGADIDSILELVKMSNLSRLPGLKKVRCRIYYEGGLDTFSKILAVDPSETHRILSEFAERTGFEGSPPTENDAEFAISMARFLPEIIEF